MNVILANQYGFTKRIAITSEEIKNKKHIVNGDKN